MSLRRALKVRTWLGAAGIVLALALPYLSRGRSDSTLPADSTLPPGPTTVSGVVRAESVVAGSIAIVDRTGRERVVLRPTEISMRDEKGNTVESLSSTVSGA